MSGAAGTMAGWARFPWSPLIACALRAAAEPDYRHRRPNAQIAAAYVLLGTSARQAKRWRDGGLPAFTADRLAVRLGLHPAEVWSDWFEATAL